MKKIILFLSLICAMNGYSQIQLSDFTFNNITPHQPTHLQEYDNKIFFKATTDNYGSELWSSDGTIAGTNLVKETAIGTSNGLTSFYTAEINDELYFVANDNYDYIGGEIWKTDGTNGGTVFITSYAGRIFGLRAVGNLIYFIVKTDDDNLQVWKTDGTQIGTVLVKGNIPIWNYPTFQGSVNNTFIFTIQVPFTNNSKVWRSDGTSNGTYPLTSEIDGNGITGSTSDFSQYITYNNNLYFVTRYHLYKTDGTMANTTIVGDVWNAQNDLVQFGDAIEVNNKVYFSFFSFDLKKLSIYESDGTASGTSEIYTVTSNEYFYPSYFEKSGNNLIFSSVNATGGTSLFYLDTATHIASEILEIDQNPQSPNYFLEPLTALTLDRINDDLFFISTPTTFPQRKGWIYNETTSTINSYTELDNVFENIVFNEDLYYIKGYQLWKFDMNLLSIKPFANNTIQVFPNPSSDFINFSRSEGITNIEVYNVKGQLVLNIPKLINDKVDIRTLNPGTYFLKFRKDNVAIVKKIMKSY